MYCDIFQKTTTLILNQIGLFAVFVNVSYQPPLKSNQLVRILFILEALFSLLICFANSQHSTKVFCKPYFLPTFQNNCVVVIVMAKAVWLRVNCTPCMCVMVVMAYLLMGKL